MVFFSSVLMDSTDDSRNQSTPQSCPPPFDKTGNITALHTNQKTFRKPPLLFPIPTNVSVTHNRNLRPCYRFQLKTSSLRTPRGMCISKWRIEGWGGGGG
ncbi:hypothetical protein CEXT_806431 [Caerostris extrusa]|uniref:Uncharacterized protein n=1 Tax=Caerostris extrusa TaxID=172846 RepID=A0AAV4UCF2_CAEEX|nr:hypothetical protein CEXT_806431 [Caerostris extrusa]